MQNFQVHKAMKWDWFNKHVSNVRESDSESLKVDNSLSPRCKCQCLKLFLTWRCKTIREKNRETGKWRISSLTTAVNDLWKKSCNAPAGHTTYWKRYLANLDVLYSTDKAWEICVTTRSFFGFLRGEMGERHCANGANTLHSTWW